MNENERLLCEGAELMNVDLSEFQVQQLLRFHALIIKWNKVYNLSAIRDPLESIKKHFLDSLSIVCFIKPGLLLDVGSGAGLPGIVIAIMKKKKKSHKYDAMDLQRGIQQGDIRRTHHGEMNFIQQLWGKVRSGFRRYSPTGKLR